MSTYIAELVRQSNNFSVEDSNRLIEIACAEVDRLRASLSAAQARVVELERVACFCHGVFSIIDIDVGFNKESPKECMRRIDAAMSGGEGKDL